MQILDDEYYRCRLCQKKAHREVNSYIYKITDKIHIRICRKCYLVVTKLDSLKKKIFETCGEEDENTKNKLTHKKSEG